MGGYDSLLSIFESFLGKSKNGVNTMGQVQFDCPLCDNGAGKKNLEVNFRNGKFNAWCCGETNGMRGSLSKLVSRFGSDVDKKMFRDEIRRIEAEGEYKLLFVNTPESMIGDVSGKFLMDGDSEKFCHLSHDNVHHKEAYEYLYKRGINDELIEKYGLMHSGVYYSRDKMANRIIIPSFSGGFMNYWVGRRYDGSSYTTKYINKGNCERKNIVFNFDMVDWDGDVRIVEGPFDHIVTPNSIPLLGKTIGDDFLLYRELLHRCNGTITIILDSDAQGNSIKIYNRLNGGRLSGKVLLAPIYNGYDPSQIYQEYGSDGVSKLLHRRAMVNDLDLMLKK